MCGSHPTNVTMAMHDTGAIGPAPCSPRAARVSGSGVTQRRISCEPPLPPLSTPNLTCVCVCVCVCPFNSLTWLTHTRFVNLMQPCKHALTLPTCAGLRQGAYLQLRIRTSGGETSRRIHSERSMGGVLTPLKCWCYQVSTKCFVHPILATLSLAYLTVYIMFITQNLKMTTQ